MLVKSVFADSEIFGIENTDPNFGRLTCINGMVSVNDQKVTDVSFALSNDDFSSDVIVKKGKKNFYKLNLI